MRELDRRLLREGRRTRGFLVATVLLGTARALLLVAQAGLLAWILAGAIDSRLSIGALFLPMLALLAVVTTRALVAWSNEAAAHRCAARVKSELRVAAVTRAARIEPDSKAPLGAGELATLVVRGIDALDGYFARYLPGLVLAVIVPFTALLAIAVTDWISGAILLVTLPLVPIFGALVGVATRAHTDRQVATLRMLAGHFLDVVRGLPTLKVFGRSRSQVTVIADVARTYRRRTMATLRVAFLSSLVLELLASLSVALVAVAIGLRLLDGRLDLRRALFVLVLIPEAYLPLRQLAADYHASAEGASAAARLFALLDRAEPERGTRTSVPDPSTSGLSVRSLTLTYPGRDRPVLEGFNLDVSPGEILAITGPSGCGKTTLLQALLGFVRPEAGSIRVGGLDLQDFAPDSWLARVAWVPQHPHLFSGTIADNIRLGRPGATDAEVEDAVSSAGLARLVARLPQGLGSALGEDGAGLSAGERQRLALARAFLRDAPLLLLDEPTANLDGHTEEELLAAVRRLARGRTVVLAAHRPALCDLADRTLELANTQVFA